MSTRVGKGRIGVCLARGIKWYRSRSARMAIEVSMMKKADTSAGRCPPESGRVSLESAREGNRMVKVSKRPHGYRGQQDKRGRYRRAHMAARVGEGLIGVRSARGIEWYRS